MANIPALHPPSAILHPRPVFLAGPTAVGKSAVALALAEMIGGEIITVESMQVYRGLDIGTAKPTPAERARVPHHLIDVCDLHEAFDAAQFISLAQRAVAEIQSRGKTPVFCGGTGLYFKAFLAGLGEAPPSDEKLRAELAATPLETLLAELREKDLESFEQIDRNNPRRVIRAVAVIRLTGKPFSAQKSRWGETPGEPASPATSGSRGRSPHQSNLRAEKFFCFMRPAEDLHRRINVRVDEMFARGLVNETRGLLQHGLAENKFAMQAIGYRQVVEHLRGERGLAATIDLVKSRTRQFAKRQLTWFRRHGNCEWIEFKPDETVEETVAKIIVQK